MSKPQTIRGFQEDQAIILSDQIRAKVNEDVSPDYIAAVMQRVGVVNEYTLHTRLDRVLDDLGFDYDEIVEVAR